MSNPTRRQHFIARFYLRNFAEPMFSDDLNVYVLNSGRWERRTPNGIGWFPHLCSLIDEDGRRTDEFDQYLKINVEDPAAPALKKLAMSGVLDEGERAAVALFIGLTAARSPRMLGSAVAEYVKRLGGDERSELESLAKRWSSWVGKTYDGNSCVEFLKPSSFGAIWAWAKSLQKRLLQWQWRLIYTSRNAPFVTSDYPVFCQRDQDRNVRLVSFPVSSETALIAISNGSLNEARDRSREVYAMNRQSTCRANDFVVSCRQDFPGCEKLPSPQRSAADL